MKEKLKTEREEFLSELYRENSSKQEILDKLENKVKEQEEKFLKEKQDLEHALRKEVEQLRSTKEKVYQHVSYILIYAIYIIYYYILDAVELVIPFFIDPIFMKLGIP